MSRRKGSFTPGEIRAFSVLLKANGNPVSEDELREAFSQGMNFRHPTLVPVVIRKLRAGLGANIKVIRGYGYKLERRT